MRIVYTAKSYTGANSYERNLNKGLARAELQALAAFWKSEGFVESSSLSTRFEVFPHGNMEDARRTFSSDFGVAGMRAAEELTELFYGPRMAIAKERERFYEQFPITPDRVLELFQMFYPAFRAAREQYDAARTVISGQQAFSTVHPPLDSILDHARRQELAGALTILDDDQIRSEVQTYRRIQQILREGKGDDLLPAFEDTFEAWAERTLAPLQQYCTRANAVGGVALMRLVETERASPNPDLRGTHAPVTLEAALTSRKMPYQIVVPSPILQP